MPLRYRWAVAAAMAVGLGSIHAGAQSFSLGAYVMSAGQSVRSSSACFRLQATMAEAAPGYSASTDYSISAGFRYTTQGLGDDTIFFAGFEECTP